MIRKKDSLFTRLYERILQKTGIKLKGIVAVQKKLLTTIFFVWKNNLDFDINFNNIQKEEQVPTSPLALEKPNKKAIHESMASQGKHPVSDHSMPPLRSVKLVKEIV